MAKGVAINVGVNTVPTLGTEHLRGACERLIDDDLEERAGEARLSY
jgi:hypothetical protein